MGDIVLGVLGNAVWVVLVFAVLWVRDRKRREQRRLWLSAVMLWLVRSCTLVRNVVWPYVHLVHEKASHGTVLSTLLDTVGRVLADVVRHAEDAAGLTDNRVQQAAVLALCREVTRFQTHVSTSAVDADMIAGNPEALVASPRSEEEIAAFRAFGMAYPGLVRAVLDALPAGMRGSLPADALAALDASTPLQDRYAGA